MRCLPERVSEATGVRGPPHDAGYSSSTTVSPPRGYQLEDGHYEYSSVATNKPVKLRTLWDFMVGRGGHEKTLGELKQQLAFDTIPTHGV
jgi:hypothetical protein